jgi:16S rRNA (cytidine1402-2'-O)-methyltransferase
LQQLQRGKAIALVTDAGMPGISDPGYELVKTCVEHQVVVVPIPGVSAVITALSAAGLPTDRFTFEGFLPAKSPERCRYLETIRADPRTLVFYEAPHRVRQTLHDMVTVLGGDRSVALARELTKLHEQFWRGTLAEAEAHYREHEPQGEFTVIVSGYDAVVPVLSESALKAELQQLLQQGVSRSQASRQLAQQTSLPRRQLYQLALTIPDRSAPEADDLGDDLGDDGR